MRLDNICFMLGAILLATAALIATHLWQAEGPLDTARLIAMMTALGLGTALFARSLAPNDV